MQQQYKRLYDSRHYLLMLLPGILYYLIFHYAPMYGVIIAFKDFNMFQGIWGSPWASQSGFYNFIELFQSPEFFRVIRNTILLSFYLILFSFPMPILLALSLNEARNGIWKRSVQTITYLPHFISTVVICGMIFNFLSLDGMINQIASWLGAERIQYLLMPEYFRTIFITSDIWQTIGWGSILYLAALSGIDTSLYEAARIDGANRWHQIIHINIPALIPTIVILLIFNIGNLMQISFEKVLLLYQPNTYETADVIGTYVYRRGIIGTQFSFATAVGLFQSAIGFAMIMLANWSARKLTSNSLW
ncbi:sugar ABC transporter permease [Paenibacillus sp. PAMC21692]|uniref:ABC transporter permease n=1 Tax=Paenibacillus sp. PAMC21692 TaxID=2762320 RepID=UPI00164D1205|nr:ABC transporter permease subunit [Paenibacillus sp. PAMC21692]QNK58807.1 sugar ABC transporter permease [Paenibacillus sp. PAMC21692]